MGASGSMQCQQNITQYALVNPYIMSGKVTNIRFGTRSYTTFGVGHRDKRYLAILDLERRFDATYPATRLLKLLLTAGKSSG